MKLVKLSLAAVVAAGAFTAANAVSLDEAIQNVELKGKIRYRYDSKRVETGDVKKGIPAHKFLGELYINAAIAENFKAHTQLKYETDNDQGHGPAAKAEIGKAEAGFAVKEAYLSYSNFDTVIKGGKMKLNSFWNDNLVGDGISVTNNSIDGITLAAFMYDNYDKSNSDLASIESKSERAQKVVDVIGKLKNDKGETQELTVLSVADMAVLSQEFGGTALENLKDQLAMMTYVTGKKADKAGVTLDQGIKDKVDAVINKKADYEDKASNIIGADELFDHNLYGLAVMANFEPVNASVQFGYLNKTAMFYALDAEYDDEIADDVKLNAHVQFSGNSIRGEAKDNFGLVNSTFIGLQAGVETAGIDASLGWVTFGKKGEKTMAAFHDKGKLINVGEIAMDNYNGTTSKHNYFFGEAGYTYEALRAGLTVVFGSTEDGAEKTKKFEITPALSYNYTDKLSFSTFYAFGKDKPDYSAETKTHKVRLQAQYSF